MGKEVIQGMVGALLAIVVVVSIGSFIAQAASHGPGHGAEQGQQAPADSDEKPAQE